MSENNDQDIDDLMDKKLSSMKKEHIDINNQS